MKFPINSLKCQVSIPIASTACLIAVGLCTWNSIWSRGTYCCGDMLPWQITKLSCNKLMGKKKTLIRLSEGNWVSVLKMAWSSLVTKAIPCCVLNGPTPTPYQLKLHLGLLLESSPPPPKSNQPWVDGLIKPSPSQPVSTCCQTELMENIIVFVTDENLCA